MLVLCSTGLYDDTSWILETGDRFNRGVVGERWMGLGCAQMLSGRTALVLVFEQLIDRPKAEQWVDKVVSMASRISQESASKAVPSAYSRSVTIASCGSPQVWHHEDRQFQHLCSALDDCPATYE